MGDERTPGGPLTSEGRTLLLSIARTTIEAQVRGDRAPDVEVHAGVLKERRGAFVTLHMHGRLKGCIGYVEAHKPLHETIREMAAAAASRASSGASGVRYIWAVRHSSTARSPPGVDSQPSSSITHRYWRAR